MQRSLAERLRLLRARKGLSLLAASEQLGVDRHTLRDLELGQGRTPRYPTLAKIAKGYGVPVEDLLEEPALAGTPGKAEAPKETGLAGADPSAKLAAAKVLEEIAELWAEELTRGLYDRHTLGQMRIAGFSLAMNHDAAVREVREDLPPHFQAQLEAAEERFADVGAQIWEAREALEEANREHPAPPDELAARREAKREELRQKLRGGRQAKRA